MNEFTPTNSLNVKKRFTWIHFNTIILREEQFCRQQQKEVKKKKCLIQRVRFRSQTSAKRVDSVSRLIYKQPIGFGIKYAKRVTCN